MSEADEIETRASRPNADPSLVDRIITSITDNLQQSIKDEVRRAFLAGKREIAEISAEACSSTMEELAASAAKKARPMEPPLKKVGNQQQYKHNQALLEEIEAAERHLGKGNLERAKERLSSGKKLKHINLADREDLGWQVVKFYESDDLASDSEDEKHINRAKREATKKREAKRTE